MTRPQDRNRLTNAALNAAIGEASHFDITDAVIAFDAGDLDPDRSAEKCTSPRNTAA